MMNPSQLADRLRFWANQEHASGKIVSANWLAQAANFLEQLERERDEARAQVADYDARMARLKQWGMTARAEEARLRAELERMRITELEK